MEILANDLDHPIDPDLVLLGEASRHFLPQSDCEQSKRDQHHNPRGQEHASAQTHRSLLISRPPQSTIPRPIPWLRRNAHGAQPPAAVCQPGER